ncbi:uncharacterized protein LOC119420824 [Nematolebias whitei]|uniref:uncharacterized protein LOC119420824 n=1 Tax=Nematolebias whitei TaxID=451745 RepID=UPI00189B1E7A|nr:uncharacterized protein LOC119420824 [Nematolebias whitei]
MRILRDEVRAAARTILNMKPEILVESQSAPPSEQRFVPRRVVKGAERISPRPFRTRIFVRSDLKRRHTWKSESYSDSPQKVVFPHQMDGTPVTLKECSIPLNPVHFSPAMLVAMEKVSPSACQHVHTGNDTKLVEHPRKPSVLRSRRVSDTPCAVSGTGVEFVAPMTTVEATLNQVFVCDVPRSPPPRDTSDCAGFETIRPCKVSSSHRPQPPKATAVHTHIQPHVQPHDQPHVQPHVHTYVNHISNLMSKLMSNHMSTFTSNHISNLMSNLMSNHMFTLMSNYIPNIMSNFMINHLSNLILISTLMFTHMFNLMINHMPNLMTNFMSNHMSKLISTLMSNLMFNLM